MLQYTTQEDASGYISEGKPPTELVHQLIIPTSKQTQITVLLEKG